MRHPMSVYGPGWGTDQAWSVPGQATGSAPDSPVQRPAAVGRSARPATTRGPAIRLGE
jgi:hypothetical protein